MYPTNAAQSSFAANIHCLCKSIERIKAHSYSALKMHSYVYGHNILSILWEFAVANLNSKYKAVPPETVEAVLRFAENNFQKLWNFSKNDCWVDKKLLTYLWNYPSQYQRWSYLLCHAMFVIIDVLFYFLSKYSSSWWYSASMLIKSGTPWWTDWQTLIPTQQMHGSIMAVTLDNVWNDSTYLCM